MDPPVLPARHVTIQVKYTNQVQLTAGPVAGDEPASATMGKVLLLIGKSLSFPGSNQAREGRLVDALAVRGDEGRDNLR